MSLKPLNELIAQSSAVERTDAWQRLARLAIDARTLGISALLDAPGRYEAFSRSIPGLTLDFSRQRMTPGVLATLLDLASERQVGDWIGHLLSGSSVNNTEQRPALHTALRAGPGLCIAVDGVDIVPSVIAERERMLMFADAVRNGEHAGYAGQRITDVVNIGIGGSDLGLAMADVALKPFHGDGPRTHYVSNIDGSHLDDVLADLIPATTLFVICSKSFTTLETRLNANAAREWFINQAGEEFIPQHFVAVSVNDPAMDQFGIDPANRFRIWDWVGGRYSLWSSIGLTLAIAVGATHFRDLLAGGAAMDEHFGNAPLDQNIPVLLALIGIWNRNFLNCSSHAVLPYDDRLALLPAFLQQLEMESNGKSVTRDGQAVGVDTCPVIWGQPGSNAQHSFFQLLHQGTGFVSIDFVAAQVASSPSHEQHLHGIANMLAQAEGFARGHGVADVASDLERAGHSPNEIETLAPHKVHSGNKPNSVVLLDKLAPRGLGQLIALYEHKVFVQGAVWGVNSFDQWGVELGKSLAVDMTKGLFGGALDDLPPIAAAIIKSRR